MGEVLYLLAQDSRVSDVVGFQRPAQASRLESRMLMSASPLATALVTSAHGIETAGCSSGTQCAESSLTGNEQYLRIDSANSAAEAPASGETSAGTEANEAADVLLSDTDRLSEPTHSQGTGTIRAVDSDAVSGPELIVIDFRVRNAETLLSHFSGLDRNLHVLQLNPDDDGLRKITEFLRESDPVSAVHLITHGRDAEILLGNTRLNSETLVQHAPEILEWQPFLSSGADLLLYACDVAGSAEGEEFLQSLHRLSGADLAASNDITGAAQQGGNWNLEYTLGSVETTSLIRNDGDINWNYRLTAGSTIVVTTVDDVLDGETSSVTGLLMNPGADGLISLREAILAANADADIDEIVLGPGEFRITLNSGGQDTDASGDFDIRQGVTIRGAGADVTIISGNSIARVFDVRDSASVSISDVTITGGMSFQQDGGGIRIATDASLILNRVNVTDNVSRMNGGGISNQGQLVLRDVNISGNHAFHSGGGLYNSGTMSLERAAVFENQARHGGGISTGGGGGSTLSLINVTVSGNLATSQGGGIHAAQSTTLTSVTVAHNVSPLGAGIRSTSAVTLLNSILHENVTAAGNPLNVSGTVTSLGYNLDSDGTANLTQPTDLSGVDGGLMALANYGGFTQTHALQLTSLAIDAGTVHGTPLLDQRGSGRSGTPDIGAFELQRGVLTTSEFPVNSVTSGAQRTFTAERGSQNAIARDLAGNYIVTWSSNGQDGSGWGVYARRFDVFGNPLGPEFRVNETTSGHQQWSSVAADNFGNFVITWTSSGQDGTSQSVYARRFAADGTALSGEFRVNVTNQGTQHNSAVAMNANGQFVIVWQGEGPGDSQGIFFRRFDANGNSQDASDRSAHPSTAAAEKNPAVAIGADGSIAVAWQQQGNIHLQRFSSAGTSIQPAILISSLLTGYTDVAVEMDTAGNVVLAYQETGLLTGLWMRGYTPSGSQLFAPTLVDTGNASNASIAMSADGQFLLTWQRSGDGSGSGIYARRFFANGMANGSILQVNEHIAGDQLMPSAVMIDPDNFVIVWSGETATDPAGVAARQFGTLGLEVVRARTDFVTTETSQPVSVIVLSNDTVPAGREAVLLDVSTPGFGSAQLTGDNTVLYHPDSGYTGSDSFSYQISDGSDGTAHYWNLAGHAQDSVGAAHGVVHDATTTDGGYGTGLWFDGDSSYVAIPDISYERSFTISFQFRIDDNSGSGYQSLLSHGAWNSENSLHVYFGESEHTLHAGKLLTSFRDLNDVDNPNALTVDLSGVIGSGQWHTYTLTADENFGTRIYVDGVLKAIAADRGADSFNPVGDLHLGARSDIEPSHFLHGGIDTVRIFSRNLSAEDILQLHDTGRTDAQSEGTVHVTVLNAAPVIRTTGSYTLIEGLSAEFSADGTYDPNGDHLTFEWDFDYDGVDFNTDATGSVVFVSWNTLEENGVTPGNNTLAVRVQDSRGAVSLETISLTVIPNPAPVAVTLSSKIVPGLQPGAGVGFLTTTDNIGDQHTYTVSDSRFEVVGNLLKLKSGISVSRDSAPTVSLSVTTSDVRLNTYTQNFVLTVGNDPVIARDDILTTTENDVIAAAAPGLLINDNRHLLNAVPEAVVAFDAAQDTDGNLVWENIAADTTGWNLSLGGTSYEPSPLTEHIGILSSFQFSGVQGSGATANRPLSEIAENLVEGPVTLELWFRPESATEKSVLIDTGGSRPGTGATLILNGTQLEFRLYSGVKTALVISDISPQLMSGDFVQFAGAITFSQGSADIEMFVNGVSAGSQTVDGVTSWASGSDHPTLARRSGSGNVPGMQGSVPFRGEISQFRLYDAALTSTEVQAIFENIAGSFDGLSIADVDLDTLGTRGTVVVSADGAFTYNPDGRFEWLNEGETAFDSFRYTVTDSGGNRQSATVSVTIVGVNDAPTEIRISDIAFHGYTDAAVVGSITVDDPDHGDTHTITVSDSRFEVVADTLRLKSGQFIDPIDEAEVTLTLTATDRSGEFISRTFIVTPVNINTPPQLSFEQSVFSLDENVDTSSRIEIGYFIIRDDLVGENTLTISGTHAHLFELADSHRLFLRAGTSLNFEHTAVMTLRGTVSDSSIPGNPEDVHIVSLTLNDVNDAPQASAIPDLAVEEDSGFRSIDISTAFSDEDGDPLTYSYRFLNKTPGLFSRFSLNRSDGIIRFEPSRDAWGTAVMEITASDPAGAFATSQFTILVQPVNDAPTVTDQLAKTISGQTLIVRAPGVLRSATDVEGDEITAVLIDAPRHGDLLLNSDGSYRYRPQVGFFGTDSFRFAGTDGTSIGPAAAVIIEVQAPGTGGTSGGNPAASGGNSSAGNTTGATNTTSAAGRTTGNPGDAGIADMDSVSTPSGGAVTGGVSTSTADTKGTEDRSGDATSKSQSGNSDESDSAMRFNPAMFVKAVTRNFGREADSIVNSTEAAARDTKLKGISTVIDTAAVTQQIVSREVRYEALSPDLQRLQLYQQAATRAQQQMESFTQELSRSARQESRVVGSVGVVTTGVSVGYLIWAVRGGMLLSGVLSQIPAWTMLDPLLVIDGSGHDEEDRESLQSIVDRQQARLKPDSPEGDSTRDRPDS